MTDPYELIRRERIRLAQRNLGALGNPANAQQQLAGMETPPPSPAPDIAAIAGRQRLGNALALQPGASQRLAGMQALNSAAPQAEGDTPEDVARKARMDRQMFVGTHGDGPSRAYDTATLPADELARIRERIARNDRITQSSRARERADERQAMAQAVANDPSASLQDRLIAANKGRPSPASNNAGRAERDIAAAQQRTMLAAQPYLEAMRIQHGPNDESRARALFSQAATLESLKNSLGPEHPLVKRHAEMLGQMMGGGSPLPAPDALPPAGPWQGVPTEASNFFARLGRMGRTFWSGKQASDRDAIVKGKIDMLRRQAAANPAFRQMAEEAIRTQLQPLLTPQPQMGRPQQPPVASFSNLAPMQ